MGDPIVCESTVEAASLGWLENQGWAIAYGPDIAPTTPIAERDDYGEFVLEARLRSVVARLNPDLPSDAIDDAHHRLTGPVGATLEACAYQKPHTHGLRDRSRGPVSGERSPA